MFCAQCGKQIEGDSRFCPFCGEPVESTLADGASAAVDDAQVSQDSAAEIAAAGETPAVAGPAVAEVAPAGVSAPVEATTGSVSDAASAPSNLKAAAANSRRKSLRKMPLIVLVALAMLLVSSVAFAAYMVYTQIIAPQAQDQPVQEQVQEQQAEPGYGIETVSVEVSVPVNPEASSGERTAKVWQYDQITCTQQSDVADAINEKVKAAFDASVQRAESVPANVDEYYEWAGQDEAYGEACISRDIKITYLGDGIVCFADLSYRTLFGAHGWYDCYGVAYDLTTGEPVDMPSLFGISESEQASAVTNAVAINLASNPAGLSASEFEPRLSDPLNAEASDGTYLDGSAQFYLTDEGLVYPTGAYELGSYADGYRHIIVAAFEDDSLVGTEIDASAIFGS